MKDTVKKLHTAKAREIAGERMKYMEEYFNRLRDEIEGKC
jgi:hypothetical protein